MGVETHYALSGPTHIAYQVLGDGDMDVLSVPVLLSNIELADGWRVFAAAR
jgi:hypothetical protein